MVKKKTWQLPLHFLIHNRKKLITKQNIKWNQIERVKVLLHLTLHVVQDKDDVIFVQLILCFIFVIYKTEKQLVLNLLFFSLYTFIFNFIFIFIFLLVYCLLYFFPWLGDLELTKDQTSTEALREGEYRTLLSGVTWKWMYK